MEWTIIDGVRTLKFDLILTLALGGLLLALGYWLARRLPLLKRTNVPAPVIAGLLFASVVLVARAWADVGVALDSSLRQPLQIAFFTVVGYSATLQLLRAGGWRLGALLLLASIAAVLQNVVGIAVARALGVPAPLGIICGALTLTGGPATGLAFTGQFEQLGIEGAGALIIAAATFGIVTSSLIANPLVTLLINRFSLARKYHDESSVVAAESVSSYSSTASKPITESVAEGSATIEASDSRDNGDLLRALLLLLTMMGAGALVSGWLTKAGVTLPAYVGAMVVAAFVRNANERLRVLPVHARSLESLGVIALALFLVLALMDLKLWQLASLALPALVILLVQVSITIFFAFSVVFLLFGRDYEAAVTTSGYLGFGLGITPNAVANMEALASRFRPAPRSFLTVPIVGAFFIDFTNALIITSFLNLYR